jgi:hypothetical protein
MFHSDTIVAIRDDVKAVLPVQQNILETQRVLLTQQTTVSTLVRNSMTQHTVEAQAMRQTIQTSTQDLDTKIQQVNDQLKLLESLIRQYPSQENATPRVVEIFDDDRTQPQNEPNLEDDLAASIRSIIETIRNREGVFARDEVREIGDALLGFLKAFSSQHLVDLEATRLSQDDGGRHDAEALRKNLRAVQVAMQDSRRIELNKHGKQQLKLGVCIP